MKTNQNLRLLDGKKYNINSHAEILSQGHAERVGGAPRTSASRCLKAERFRIKYPMTPLFNNIKAFTLIELLVVVLIIGILAAVALPQYNKAVLKAQSSNLFVIMENIRRAEEAYYLENNTYTRNWSELTLTVPSTSEWNLSLWDNAVQSESSKYSGVTVYFPFEHTSYIWKGKRVCYAAMNKPKANQFCQAMAGHTTPDTSNGPNTVNIYIIP